MAGYGWTAYDTRKGGTQTIHDSVNKLDLTIELSKIPGGQHGGNWGVRVKGLPRMDNLNTTVIFYVGMEGMEPGGRPRLECVTRQDEEEFEGIVEFHGDTSGIGGFKILVQEPKTHKYPTHTDLDGKERPRHMTFVKSMVIPEDMIWQAKCECYTLLSPTFCSLRVIFFLALSSVSMARSLSSVYQPKHFFPEKNACPDQFQGVLRKLNSTNSMGCYKLTRVDPLREAVFLDHIKNSDDSQMKNHGPENLPPRETFVTTHEPGKGNMHFVQKVFEGAFEVGVQLTKLGRRPS